MYYTETLFLLLLSVVIAILNYHVVIFGMVFKERLDLFLVLYFCYTSHRAKMKSSVEIIESGKGKQQVLFKGYKYCLKRVNKNNSKQWKCVSNISNKQCCGRITTDSANSVIRESAHTCEVPPNEALTEIEKAKSVCRKRAREETTPIPKIYEEEFYRSKSSGFEFVTKLPALEAIKSSMYRHRHTALGVLPTTREDFRVTDFLNETEDGTNFVIFDEGTSERIIGFGSQMGIRALSSQQTIFGDGTFKSCSKLFDQLYTFHVDLKSTDNSTCTRPALYALLPNRKTETYMKLFSLMTKHIPFFNPVHLKIDFEQAVISATREMFPDCKLNGCNFHFNQSIWRKVQDLGLATLYKQDKAIRRHIKLTAALSHLPPEYIDDGWIFIMETSPINDAVVTYNDYFVTQWLDNPAISDMWICYNERHRTTNICESWHSRLNRQIAKAKPNINELILGLKTDAKYYDIVQQRLENNISPKKRLLKYSENDKLIKIIINDLKEHGRVGDALEKLINIVKL